MASPKEQGLNKKLLNGLTGKPRSVADLLIHDQEVRYLQDYANTVSIKRLHFNDHGPVHMRKVALNTCRMVDLLRNAGIPSSLEHEEVGTWEDSLSAIILAAFLHDCGMSVGREDHEVSSVMLGLPIAKRVLQSVYPEDPEKVVILTSLFMECVLGHMAGRKIHSLEAGILLIADGCDMEKGRARIPMMMDTESRVGDIHKYSANAIESVTLSAGKTKPIRITVVMNESVGFFQIEEVLLQKVNMSPAKGYIELEAGVTGGSVKRYL
ncbi:MAG: phosphohydrolase [Spirochaetales bacterium]|nr:phosphohydrolase [Spirochaetales bacterium]